MNTPRLVTLAALVAATLPAQNTLVSPAPASATLEGSTSNAFPWNTTLICRYMQVHSDTIGTVMVVNKVAQRRDGLTAAANGSRSVDLEMYMGDSIAWDRIRYVFVDNYVAPPTLVLPRQVVNIGPTASPSNPAPFELAVPLSTPFVYTGVNSLAWEIVQYSNTAVGTIGALDVQSGSANAGAAAATTGPGCIATGQSATMTLGVQHGDRGGAYQFGCFVANAPVSSPVVLYLGVTNPNQPVPGLCGSLHTDLAASLGVALADASGFVREIGTSTTISYPHAPWTFVLPNTLGQPTLYAQAHALDTGRTDPLPICNSDGISWQVPARSTTTVAQASRLYNFQLQGPSYPHATPLTLMHGYAAVTEFTY